MSFKRAMARGFTLIEMAIVLVVIGLVLSGGLVAVAPILENSKVSDTRSRMQRIEDALQVYVVQYSCLPCPAAVAGDGTSQFTSAASGCGTGCTAVRGVVPWQTLGLSRADGSDAFGTRFTYEVTAALVVANSMTRSGSSYAPPGTIIVNSATGTITTAAAYVIVSHGSNKHFGYNEVTGTQVTFAAGQVNEDENGDADNTYIQDDFNQSVGANYFDDITLWRSKPLIIQQCGDGSCGNPA